jgi:hypothetical protein
MVSKNRVHTRLFGTCGHKAVRSVRCTTQFNVSSQDRRASCLLAGIWAKHGTNFVKMLQLSLCIT